MNGILQHFRLHKSQRSVTALGIKTPIHPTVFARCDCRGDRHRHALILRSRLSNVESHASRLTPGRKPPSNSYGPSSASPIAKRENRISSLYPWGIIVPYFITRTHSACSNRGPREKNDKIAILCNVFITCFGEKFFL
mgnify:CR=1 FL=1